MTGEPRPHSTTPLLGSAPPVGLVLGAVGSVQFGSALAVTLFDTAGPVGAVFLRLAFSAPMLAALWRPRLRSRPRRDLLLAVSLGLVLASMNSLFYLSIDRIPLGIAVTFEFVGPLGIAVATSRRRLDLLWIALAGAGIGLLSGGDLRDLDPVGVGFALGAGCLWGAYILVTARVGRVFPGGSGLAIALVVGAAAVTPFGLPAGGASLLDAEVLGVGAAVALLSSVIPYSLELEALRRMAPAVFGVLMSLEPALAAVAGFAVLGQRLAALEAVAIALVVVASAGVARADRSAPRS